MLVSISEKDSKAAGGSDDGVPKSRDQDQAPRDRMASSDDNFDLWNAVGDPLDPFVKGRIPKDYWAK
jgi:hypothetical protein